MDEYLNRRYSSDELCALAKKSKRVVTKSEKIIILESVDTIRRYAVVDGFWVNYVIEYQ